LIYSVSPVNRLVICFCSADFIARGQAMLGLYVILAHRGAAVLW
jgi:hypothetical protein